MALRRLILLAAVMAAHCLNIVYGLDQAERDLVTELHKTYRQKEGACDMNALKYSVELENRAAEHAAKCKFEHNYADDIGENMAWFMKTVPDKEIIKRSMVMWCNEKASCPNKEWSKCGHYSQVVWAATTLFGCAIYICDDSKPYRKYIFCFYQSPGNIVGQEMYKTNCTKNCTEGKVWIKGLCYDIGSKEAQEANDSNNNDENSKSKGDDTPNVKQGTSSKSSIQDKTKTTPTTTTATTTTTTTTTKPRTANSNCKDSKGWCPHIVKDCTNPQKADWTKKYCPKTCGVC